MKTWRMVAAVIAVLLVGMTAAYLTLRTKAPVNEQALAEAKKAAPACLLDNTALKIDSSAQTGIEQAALSKLTTVPAGTNVDIYIATYDTKTANGSAVYPGAYGTYNFTVKKDSSSAAQQPDWKLTSFTPCKKY